MFEGGVRVEVKVRCLWGGRGAGAGGMIIEDAIIPFLSSRFEIPVFEINI